MSEDVDKNSQFACRRATAWNVAGLIRILESDYDPDFLLAGISGSGRGVKVRLNEDGRVELS